MRKYFKYAMESEQTDGNVQVEKEHIIWAKLRTVSQLQDANHAEKQSQYSVVIDKSNDNFVEGVIRVRKTEDSKENVKYILTMKQKHENGNTEVEVEVTEDFYVQMAGIASTQVIKHRYEFPIEGSEHVWQVDCAPDGEGSYHEWVRIEIEVDDLEAQIPSLPFVTDDTILPPIFGKITQEEWEARNNELFNAYFLKKGPFVKYKEEPKPLENKATVANDSDGDKNQENETPEASEETNGEEDTEE